MGCPVVSLFRQFCDVNGIPYAGGTVTVYEAGTTNPGHVFADRACSVHCNVFLLDSVGKCKIFTIGTLPEFVDIVVKNSDGKEVDGIEGVSLLQNVYSKGEVDEKIAEAASGTGRFLGTMRCSSIQVFINEGRVNIGDSAVVTDAGTVVYGGNEISCSPYDEIVCDGSTLLKKGRAKYGIQVVGEQLSLVSY